MMATIEHWNANPLPKAIRDQLNLSKSTLKRILAFARANPALDPEAERQKLPAEAGGFLAQEAD
jgi:hypothetical protein